MDNLEEDFQVHLPEYFWWVIAGVISFSFSLALIMFALTQIKINT